MLGGPARSARLRSAGVDRQGVDAARHQRVQGIIYEAMPGHPRQAGKAGAGDGDAEMASFTRAGVTGIATCAVSGLGVARVRERCLGRRMLFVGHSGVGKSTLLAALEPGRLIAQGEVNEVTGKGRHTTTAAVLYRAALEPGGVARTEVVDTPGVRAFALWGVEADDLVDYYPELEPFIGRCRFGDCRHDREPGCALREAVAQGAVGERRFASYCKLRDELAGGHH